MHKYHTGGNGSGAGFGTTGGDGSVDADSRIGLFTHGQLQFPSQFSTFVRPHAASGLGLNDSTLSAVIGGAFYITGTVSQTTPMYSRRISLQYTGSLTSPFGMAIPQTASLAIPSSTSFTSSVGSLVKIFEGGAHWDAGDKRQVRNADGTFSSSPKQPFYDTYEDYVEDIRNFGKNYSIIPEFRMSTQIEDYIRTDGDIEIDMFDVSGGISGSELILLPQKKKPPSFSVSINSKEKSNFYEIYSNTDFMKNFEVIADDHKDFTNGKVLSLRCKAIKKFLPYEGFYPCQRTVDLAKRFYESL